MNKYATAVCTTGEELEINHIFKKGPYTGCTIGEIIRTNTHYVEKFKTRVNYSKTIHKALKYPKKALKYLVHSFGYVGLEGQDLTMEEILFLNRWQVIDPKYRCYPSASDFEADIFCEIVEEEFEDQK